MKQLLLFLILLTSLTLAAQPNFYANYEFGAADTLRGALSPARTCFDVTFYDINLKIDINKQFISGTVDINYKIEEDFTTLQLDLYENMDIQQITLLGQPLKFRREYNAVFVDFPIVQKKGSVGGITVTYSGNPIVAKRAPWDGGFIYTEREAAFALYLCTQHARTT